MTIMTDEDTQIVAQALADGAALLEPYEDDEQERRILALSAALAFECVVTHLDDDFIEGLHQKFMASTRQFIDIYRETARSHNGDLDA